MTDGQLMSGPGLRSYLIQILKVVTFFVIFSITVEICARIDDLIKYDAPFWGEYTNDRLRSTVNAGFPYNLPKARFEKWQHNSLGFRGPEIAQLKPTGLVRVVCVGSSESYGLYESRGKEWPSQLQDILSSHYEVINASVVGLSLKSFEPYLERHVFPLQPDVVMLVVNPLFYVTGLVRAAESKKKASQTLQKKSTPVSVSLKSKLLENSRSIPKVKQVLKQAIATHFPDLLKKYQFRDTQRQVEEVERVRLNGRKPFDVIPEGYLNNYRMDLVKTVKLIKSKGIQVVLFTYPTLIEEHNQGLYPEIFLDNRKYCIELSLSGILYTINRSNRVVVSIAKEQNTLLVDAASVLPKSIEYFADNVHYTDNGARLFAESAAAQLNLYQSNK